jgi:diguanylate cyclase (GGDEF)-like protein
MWLGGLLVVVSLVAGMSFVFSASFLLTATGDIAELLLLISLSAAIAWNIGVTHGPVRAFWTLMFAGVGLWLSAQGMWTYLEVVLHKEVPNPFVGDIAIVLHLIPIVAALALRPDIESQRLGLRSLDFTLLFGWWLYLYLFLVIPWQYIVLDSKIYGIDFDVLYFAGHVVVLSVCAHAWRNSTGRWRTAYGSIFCASCLYAVASIAASVAIDYGKYYTGSFYDIPLLVSIVLLTRMALVGRHAGSVWGSHDARFESAHPWVTSLVITASTSLPLLAAWAVFFSSAPLLIREYRLALTLAMMVFVGTLRSIRQHVMDKEFTRINDELHQASVTDALTGVRNRRFLASMLEKDVQQALRLYSTLEANTRNRDLIFYVVDIDHFKFINDRFGHQEGDALLVQVAERISAAIRHSDVLIRWGGEEFLVVSRFTDRENAEILARRILQSIGREEFNLASGKVRRTCSIGWAAFPWWQELPEAVRYQDVLCFADRALYEAKNAGRNTAVGMLPDQAGSGEVHRPLGSLLTTETPTKTVLTVGP